MAPRTRLSKPKTAHASRPLSKAVVTTLQGIAREEADRAFRSLSAATFGDAPCADEGPSQRAAAGRSTFPPRFTTTTSAPTSDDAGVIARATERIRVIGHELTLVRAQISGTASRVFGSVSSESDEKSGADRPSAASGRLFAEIEDLSKQLAALQVETNNLCNPL